MNTTKLVELDNEKEYSESLDSFIQEVGTDTKSGLSTSEVKKRQEANGFNELKKDKSNSIGKILLHQFKDLLNIMLGILAIVDFVMIPFLEKDMQSDHIVQGAVLLVIVVINIGLATFQEAKANSALEALQKASSPVAKVLRDGKVQTILSKELVVGDIVYLEDGVIVPADLRLFETNSLKIEEAALTGESLPVTKDSSKESSASTPIGDRANCAFSSTIVNYGSGIGIVSSIGMNTEVGKIAKLLNTSSKNKDLPPLKKKINKLTKVLTIVCFILLALMMILNFVFYMTDYYPSFSFISDDYKFWINLETIINSVALAVSLIPVALPVTTTVIFSISVSRMAKKNALCKELTVVETLGNASVICSDKTGTLTLNKMTVTAVADYNDIADDEAKTPVNAKKDIKRYKHLICAGMFCNNAEIDPKNKDMVIGDPTEAALLHLGEATDLDVSKTRNKYERVYEQPFDSVRKRMTTVYKTKKGYVSFTKGAAESMLDLCDFIETQHGPRAITAKDKEMIKDFLNKLSAKALRVLGMASCEFKDAPTKDSNYEANMTFLGVVGMIDPPRKEVAGAIKSCHNAGVNVCMITGDHQITALAIARELGIVHEHETKTMTGPEIDALNDKQLENAVKDCHVYARVSPDNKLRIVKAFKSLGFVTGMTGDGTNDAPALKEANIGIAMGVTGTDVAKGAASVILLDDNFSTIETAICDGRKITRNIRNVISFILSTNLATALFIFLFTYLYGTNPITITQRLLLDLVTDTLPCIFIGLNGNTIGLMNKRGKNDDKLFDKHMLVEILLNAACIFISTTAVFLFCGYGLGLSEIPAQSPYKDLMDACCFIALSLSRILLSFTYISKKESLFSSKGKAYWEMYMACGISAALLFIFVFVPGVNIIVKTNDAPWAGHYIVFALIFTLPFLSIIVSEIKKSIVRLIDKKQTKLAV